MTLKAQSKLLKGCPALKSQCGASLEHTKNENLLHSSWHHVCHRIIEFITG